MKKLLGRIESIFIALTIIFLSFAILIIEKNRIDYQVSTNNSSAKTLEIMPNLHGENAEEYLKEQGLYKSLGDAMAASRYSIYPTKKAPLPKYKEAFEANNPRQAFSTYFTKDGVHLVSKAKDNKWRVQMNLKGYSQGDELIEVEETKAEVQKKKSRIELTKSANKDPKSTIIEWYENRKDGLEQGWTINEKLEDSNEKLKLVLELGGDLKPKLASDKQAINFIRTNNEQILRYDKLISWDAKGKHLESRMELVEKQLSIIVDDKDAIYPITIDPFFTQTKKLTASDANATARFGNSVSISGDTAIVGAFNNDDASNLNSGSAYIFERNKDGGNNWGEVKKITAFDPNGAARFGFSVAISGDTAIVGAYQNDSAGSNSGSAYIFERNVGGVDNWGEQRKLTASDAAVGDRFGISVAISGDTAIVGASENDDVGLESGSAYIFERNFLGGDNWGEIKKLTSSDAASGDSFGTSVGISDDTAIVGARFDDDGGGESGSAYLFERNIHGADNWGQSKKLTASDAASGDIFGNAVAISGSTVVVGAFLKDASGTNSGAAYVFERNGGFSAWQEVKKLTPNDLESEDRFGVDVSISTNTIIVGAYQGDGIGTAYIFGKNENGADNWGEKKKLTASDLSASDQFGISVSVSGDTAIVGASESDGAGNASGSAYIYTNSSNNWQEIRNKTASDGVSHDNFGFSVAISGNTAIVGAPGKDLAGNSSGVAYIFERNREGADVWGEVERLVASDTNELDRFGYSVAISGNVAIVGAWGNSDAGGNTGSAYIFERNQGGANMWEETKKIIHSNPAADDAFGVSVGISGDTAIVGAFGVSVKSTDSGAAYVFSRNSGGTDNWGQVRLLIASDDTTGDEFGISVAISGDTAIVGAWRNDDSGGSSGSAYIFERNMTGNDLWGQVQKITASDSTAGDNFGVSVGISNDAAIVGASGNDDSGSNSGSAYIFERNTNGADIWGEVTKILASDFGSGDNFGWSVGISGETAVIGAYQEDENGLNSGSAYIIERNTGGENNWGEIKKIIASDGGFADNFGYSVSISGNTAIISAHQNDNEGTNSGSAYIFDEIANNKPIFDFDGDSKTDVSIFRPAVGEWWYLKSSDGGNFAVQFGTSNDTPVPADFTGDGKTDIAFFRAASNEWFVLRSEDQSFYSFQFGASGDIPAPGDFDGDNKDDVAVFRPSTGTWFIIRSSDNQTDIIGFGADGDKPVVGDYDGDGKDDVAIFRPTVSQWWINRSRAGVLVYQFGQAGDKTVQGDHTGDGKADVGFYRPASGEWFVIRSEDQSFYSFPFGNSTDIPSPGDYDGDGQIDAAVFRPSTNTWFINGTTSGTQIVGFGATGDTPIPSTYSVP